MPISIQKRNCFIRMTSLAIRAFALEKAARGFVSRTQATQTPTVSRVGRCRGKPLSPECVACLCVLSGTSYFWLAAALVFAMGRSAASTPVGEMRSLKGPVIEGIDRNCVEQLSREGVAQWQKISRSLSDFEVDFFYAMYHDYSDGLNSPQENRIDFIYCSGVAGKLAIEPGTVSGTNLRYAFTVGKANEWYLRNCQAGGDAAAGLAGGNVSLGDAALQSFGSIWNTRITDMLASPDWRLVGAGFAESPSGNRGIARVKFEYCGKSGKGNPTWQSGATYWAELLPEKQWIVTRSGIEGLRDGGGVELRIQETQRYQEWFGGEIFPAESVLEYEEVVKGRVTDAHVGRFGVPRRLERPEEQYFLPFYGISESAVPQLGEGAAHGQRVLLAITGLICLVLAILVIWRRQALYSRQ